MAGMDKISLTRREFLQSTAAAGSAAALAGITPVSLWSDPAAPASGQPIPAWASKPMRWFQLAFVEDDPIHCSPSFWLDYFKRTRSEGVCLSGCA